MKEITFTVEEDEEGGYCAFADVFVGEEKRGRINTQGETISELKEMIADAVNAFFHREPQHKPHKINLQIVESFVLA